MPQPVRVPQARASTWRRRDVAADYLGVLPISELLWCANEPLHYADRASSLCSTSEPRDSPGCVCGFLGSFALKQRATSRPGASRTAAERTVPLPRRLRSNVAWAFLGNVVYSASQWGVLIVLAHVGSPVIVGQFALGLAVTAPIFLTGDLNLRVVQATDTKRHYAFGEYLALNLLLTPAQLALIALVAILIDLDAQGRLVVLAVGLSKGVESTTIVFYGLFQQCERMDYVARSQIVRGLLGLLSLTLVFVATGSLPLSVLAMGFAWSVGFAVQDLRSARRLLLLPYRQVLRPVFNWRRLRRLTYAAFPLGADAGIKSLTVNIPRYLLQALQGSARLGIFAAVAQFAQTLGLITTALGNAVVPRLATHVVYREGVAFTSLMLRLLAMAAILGVASVLVAALWGEELLTLVLGAAYADRLLFVVLMVGAALTTVQWVLGFAMQASRRFGRYLMVDVVGAVFVMVASMALIPVHGAVGAALGIVVGYAAAGVASAFVVRELIRKLL